MRNGNGIISQVVFLHSIRARDICDRMGNNAPYLLVLGEVLSGLSDGEAAECEEQRAYVEDMMDAGIAPDGIAANLRKRYG